MSVGRFDTPCEAIYGLALAPLKQGVYPSERPHDKRIRRDVQHSRAGQHHRHSGAVPRLVPAEKITFDYRRNNGEWQRQTREVYDRGNGAAILLFNRHKRTVVLTRQFRLPVFVNGHDGLLIEVAAGLLEGAAPEQRIR